MNVDLGEYRASEAEQARVASLQSLFPSERGSAIDIGARDGYISKVLARIFGRVVALDLTMPDVVGENITCVEGNVLDLPLEDNTFDLVLCAEVLEHIPPAQLPRACDELTRIAKGHVLIGVPYRQDTRVGQTTCRSCGKTNPPWGHVNRFTEDKLKALFPKCSAEKIDFVGTNSEATNWAAATFMTIAGNPFGTYEQDEPCVHCGAVLVGPASRSFFSKVATKAGSVCRSLQQPFIKPHPNWIHILFRKNSGK